MIIIHLEISELFFTTLLVCCKTVHDVTGKCIVLRLSEEPTQIEQQNLDIFSRLSLRRQRYKSWHMPRLLDALQIALIRRKYWPK